MFMGIFYDIFSEKSFVKRFFSGTNVRIIQVSPEKMGKDFLEIARK